VPTVSDPAGPTPASTWLGWFREVQSLAQAGLAYAHDPFDAERYARLRDLAAEMTAALVHAPPERLRMLFRAEEAYLTPKLDVRAAVFDESGRVLLVRERQDGLWTLPGGWADIGESVAEGAVREVREESGYEVVAERLLGLYERERWGHPVIPHFTLKAVVACRMVGGAASGPNTEIDGVGWFGREEVPALSEGRCSAMLLRRAFAHHDDPGLGADLD
jgi:ADP-ribose pyrophosphatase YjhB (NUDIX family)